MTAADLIARAGDVRREGRPMEAAALYGQAADLARAAADPVLLAHALRHQGEILSIAGETAAAEAPLAEALEIVRALPGVEPLDLANAVRPLGILRAGAGHASAGELLTEARGLYARAGVDAGVAEMDRRLATLG
ncbi:hypothetical protein BrevBR_09155 [Brevundimonas sp. BR2-1]|uniref:hypothetical protein n=1 Tax=Brevundimonas sp. BR2-1 TaxID=3031123 RepID=UPI0030A10805